MKFVIAKVENMDCSEQDDDIEQERSTSDNETMEGAEGIQCDTDSIKVCSDGVNCGTSEDEFAIADFTEAKDELVDSELDTLGDLSLPDSSKRISVSLIRSTQSQKDTKGKKTNKPSDNESDSKSRRRSSRNLKREEEEEKKTESDSESSAANNPPRRSKTSKREGRKKDSEKTELVSKAADLKSGKSKSKPSKEEDKSNNKAVSKINCDMEPDLEEPIPSTSKEGKF